MTARVANETNDQRNERLAIARAHEEWLVANRLREHGIRHGKPQADAEAVTVAEMLEALENLEGVEATRMRRQLEASDNHTNTMKEWRRPVTDNRTPRNLARPFEITGIGGGGVGGAPIFHCRVTG